MAASVVVASCSSGYDFEDSYYGPHAENLSQSESFISSSESNFSEEFTSKLNLIQQIIETILVDRREMKKFINDPDEYIASKEMNFNLVLQEPERKLLLAFADDDVLSAVKTKDVEAFLSLCSERGYIGLINEYSKPENVRMMFKTDEDYEEFMDLIDSIDGYNISTKAVAGVPVAVVAGAVFYVGVAVVYAAGAGITVGVEGLVAVDMAVATSEAVYVNSENSTKSKSMGDNEQALRIWTENNGMISNPIFYTELIDKQANLFMEIIEKEFTISHSASESIANILRIQLEGYYGLRK